jgi:hypothetical protein
MDSSISTALVPIDRYFADGQELALAGFLAGYQGSTRDAYALDLRQFVVCARTMRGASSSYTAWTSNASDASWKPAGGLVRPSYAEGARSRVSTATRRRKASLRTHLRSMCVVPGSTTSRTRLAWPARAVALADRTRPWLETFADLCTDCLRIQRQRFEAYK